VCDLDLQEAGLLDLDL